MKVNSFGLRALGIAALTLLAVWPAGAVRAATVTTVAGSGRSGFADGPAQAASFMLPVGIAWDSKGRLVVADAAAQRIRVVLPDGSVHTIAGSGEPAPTGLWVAGGFADGDGDTTRFDTPLGIAIGPHDEIYVADSRNHCIRLVTPAGHVSTFAGHPSRNANLNGPRERAAFGTPVSVAVDPKGDVYVAELSSGVRKIAPNGEVSTLPLRITSPLAIAIAPANDTPLLWVANAEGLWRVDLTKLNKGDVAQAVARFSSGAFPYPLPKDVPGITRLAGNGQANFGYPTAVSVVDEVGLVYTDAVGHTVRYLNHETQDLQVIGGRDIDSAARNGGGFQDGSTGLSRFDAPMGIAARPDGTIAVADSGNKRIRLITNIDRRQPFYPIAGALPKVTFAPQDYRIGLIGASTIWGSGTFYDSVGGQLQRVLEQDPSFGQLQKRPKVMPVRMGSSLSAMRSYADLLAETRFVDCIVVVLTDFSVVETYGVHIASLVRTAPAWQGRMSGDLAAFQASMDRAHMPVLFVTEPLSFELGLDAQTIPSMQDLASRPPPDGSLEKVANAPFERAHVNWFDAWPAFYADERSPDHLPLFLSLDGHFTEHGDAVMGRAIAARLMHLKPWNAH